MYRCESWTIKKAECRRIDAFELWCWRRLLRGPYIARRSNQSILKGDQSWIFIGRTDAKAETPILWPPDTKNWLTWKDPDAGRDWMWEENGMIEDVMLGSHPRITGHKSESTPGVGEGQGSLACCSPWDRRELDMTEWLNNNISIESVMPSNHLILCCPILLLPSIFPSIRVFFPMS